MLQRDYLEQLIQEFCFAVADPLRRALLESDELAIPEIEQAVSKLIDLDSGYAMSLAPQSLVTIMQLAGVSDMQATYAAYALRRVSDVYAALGKTDLAQLRRQQADAFANAFVLDDVECPQEFVELEQEYLNQER